MTDIVYDEKSGTGIACSAFNVTQTIGNGIEPRPHFISTTDTGRMLGAGWLLYLASLIFNFILYKMHPSSPEMWTWGAEEKLDEEEETEAEGEIGLQIQ